MFGPPNKGKADTVFCMRATMVLGRRVQAGAFLAVLSLSAASAASEGRDCGCDPLPAPVRRPYRHEPEEDTVAVSALRYYFKAHPPPASERACVALPGHRALSRKAREALVFPGLELEKRPDCRYEEGRILWAATGVWRTGSAEFVARRNMAGEEGKAQRLQPCREDEGGLRGGPF